MSTSLGLSSIQEALSQELILENIFSYVPLSSGKNICLTSKFFYKTWVDTRLCAAINKALTIIARNALLQDLILEIATHEELLQKFHALKGPHQNINLIQLTLATTKKAYAYLSPDYVFCLFTPEKKKRHSFFRLFRLPSDAPKPPPPINLLENIGLLTRTLRQAKKEIDQEKSRSASLWIPTDNPFCM